MVGVAKHFIVEIMETETYAYLFPSCVAIKNLPSWLAKLEEPTKKYLDLSRNADRVWWDGPNIPGVTTNFKYRLEQQPEFADFCDFLKDEAKKFLVENGIVESSIRPFGKLELWANEMIRGSFHRRHVHPGSIVSGTFYIEAPEDSPSIVMYDPRLAREMLFTPGEVDTKGNSALWTETYFKPYNGLLLMWNSWMPHQVPVSMSDKPRIALSFNISY